MELSLGPSFAWSVSNVSTLVLTSYGDSLASDGTTSHVQGAKVVLLSSGEVTRDIEEIELLFSEGYTAGSAVETLFELFVDPAGGTTYTSWIPEICVGKADVLTNNGGRVLRFRRHIPAGSSVAGAIRSSVVAQTTRCVITGYGLPRYPMRRATVAQGFGTITNSSGVAITPGTSGAKGSWTEVGTLDKPLWGWTISPSWDDSTLLSQNYALDLAFGDASNKTLIIADALYINNSTRDAVHSVLGRVTVCPVPSGMKLYARACCTGVSADSNMNVRVVGVGG